MKRQGTARFGCKPLDCAAGEIAFEGSLYAAVLSTYGLYQRQYGLLSL